MDGYFSDMNNNYDKILAPLIIKSCTIPNRIFFPPICFNWADTNGSISERLHNFYVTVAEGGCGLIITGCAAVSPDSILYERSMRIYSDAHIISNKKLCREILNRGAVPAIQLNNFGRQSVTTYTGKEVYGPSAIPCPNKYSADVNYKIREMSYDDIERVTKDFIHAALLSAEAGYKIIQLHAGHGFLLNQFLSPYTNKRKDEYGGSLENRTRFTTDIIKGIRKELGDAMVLDIRLSVDELVPGGLKPVDFKEIIPIFECAGIDMLNVSLSIGETSSRILCRQFSKEGIYSDVSKEIKQYATKPIAHAGFIASLETGERLLRENKMDLVGMGRAQIADPLLVQKSLHGHETEINRCRWDFSCIKSLHDNNINKLVCSINKNI